MERKEQIFPVAPQVKPPVPTLLFFLSILDVGIAPDAVPETGTAVTHVGLLLQGGSFTPGPLPPRPRPVDRGLRQDLRPRRGPLLSLGTLAPGTRSTPRGLVTPLDNQLLNGISTFLRPYLT